ncbi:MAG: tRNA lysidine(34) synthetase TilS [Candidatus Brocadiaceae bacterium]|nr:tRNA lysidine(34) synthetase TilS [Candidatus Brocadiaceae bacterium]
MPLNKLVSTIRKTINVHNLIKPEETVIVGVSGGPDSVALLKILYSINTIENLRLRLFTAHLNHQLRGTDSEKDACFVQKLAENHSLPFLLKSVNIQKIAKKNNYSIEETARRERYAFFTETSHKYNASLVATGHTADDNAETFLHRILRGTGIHGLGGIPIKRPLDAAARVQLIRPLLFIWRKDILKYLREEHLTYRTDTSNYETNYLRNKIRLELIPFLENRYNPGIKNALIQLCQIVVSNNEYLSLQAEKIVKKITLEESKDSYTINTCLLTKQPKILQHLILLSIMEKMHVPLKKIQYGHYTKILDAITKTGRGRQFQLPGKFHFWHEHEKLSLCKEFPQKSCFPMFQETTLQIPGITTIDSVGQFMVEIAEVLNVSLETFKKQKTRDEEILDLQCVLTPVTVRTRKAGDKISPLGTHGYKKLKDLFIEEKISRKERETIPIVVMNNQPILVTGICIDNRVKITSSTKKVLKLTFKRFTNQNNGKNISQTVR